MVSEVTVEEEVGVEQPGRKSSGRSGNLDGGVAASGKLGGGATTTASTSSVTGRPRW
jgi:hypothetical protein